MRSHIWEFPILPDVIAAAPSVSSEAAASRLVTRLGLAKIRTYGYPVIRLRLLLLPPPPRHEYSIHCSIFTCALRDIIVTTAHCQGARTRPLVREHCDYSRTRC